MNKFINDTFGETLKLYYAQVVSDDSSETEQTGAVQVNILGVTEGWKQTHLPFAYPLNQSFGSSSSSGEVKIPLVDSYIWICNLFNKWYYIFDGNQSSPASIAKKYFDEIQDNLGELDQITQPDLEYPNNISFFYPSGLVQSFSSDSEKAIYSLYHPDGSFVLLDESGNYGMYSVGDVELKNSDGAHIYSDGKNLNIETSGNSIEINEDDGKIIITDKNNNVVTMDNTGIVLEDLSGNTTTMSSSGIELEDASGGKISMTSAGININNGNLQVLP